MTDTSQSTSFLFPLPFDFPTSPRSPLHLFILFSSSHPSLLFILSLSPHLPLCLSILLVFTSEMDATSAPPDPPDTPVPSSSCTRPPSITQHARPSPYAYTLPAFTRAHPPALPKIFQPGAGSGIGPRDALFSLCGSDYLAMILSNSHRIQWRLVKFFWGGRSLNITQQ